MVKRYAWLILILLSAATLRLAAIDDIPPGLTHDEADHGLDAWGVVNGERPIYFTVGYGREPFYDYATAGLMTFLGPSFLAGRLTSAFLSLILIAGTYAWASRAFGRKTALLTAAGLAVSIWAVMTSRQALRSITLPAMFVLALYFFWRAVELSDGAASGNDPRRAVSFWQRPATGRFALAGVLLGVTLYTYVPARILWLLFPALLLLLLFYDRRRLAAAWTGTLLTLLVALALTIPLALYLNANPGVEERLDELSVPLTAARQGDLGPILENTLSSSLLLTFQGDSQWRYNIPGRPFLSPLMAGLFFASLAIGVYWIIKDRNGAHVGRPPSESRLPRQVGFLFSVLWLLLGLSPALISGPDLSTTRAIGLQPVLYVFPAITLAAFLAWQRLPGTVSKTLVVLLFVALGLQTARDYFLRWADAPEVRVHYEASLIEAIDYVTLQGDKTTAISTTTPNRYHSPAIATLALADADNNLRWFDGNHSLLLPQDESSTLIFSGFAPLNPYLENYLDATPVAEIPMKEEDLDRPLTVFETNGQDLAEAWVDRFDSALAAPIKVDTPVQIGQSLEFLGYELLTPDAGPGNQFALATLWRVKRPLDKAMLFTQVLGPDGLPLAQSDRLDVPGDFWVSGDVFIQLHQFALPGDLATGDYPLAIGVYTTDDMQRQPVFAGGRAFADHLLLPPLSIDS
jgi:4-amino-4-deoxy-L-arabinose transferase-like glycosyltransferase